MKPVYIQAQDVASINPEGAGMSADKITCAHRGWDGPYRKICRLTGKLEHDGKMWCAIHHPPTVAAKKAARDAAWQEKWKNESTVRMAHALADAEQARRAECFDDLLAALQAIIAEVKHIDSDGYADCDLHRDEIEAARAAITRATGGTL